MKMKMTRNEDGFGIDITEWGLPKTEEAVQSLVDLAKKAASEALEIAISTYPPEVFFMCLVDDDDDPLMISVGIPLGESDGDSPSWNFSLTELVEKELELTPNVNDVDSMNAIGSALRALADRIDQRIAKINIGGIA